MAYGIETNTSSGRRNILEVRTWVLHKEAFVTFPSSSLVGAFLYISYPLNWIPESQSANSFVSGDAVINLITPPEDNPYQVGYFYTDEDNANSRLKVTLHSDLDSNHTLTVSFYFLARSA